MNQNNMSYQTIIINDQEFKLTDKELAFCNEYIIDWNATRATIAAGYSSRSAREIGRRMLTKVDIKAYIDFRRKSLQEASGVSALGILYELKKIAFGNVADFRSGWMTLKAFDDLTEAQKAMLSEITHIENTGKSGNSSIVKFKVHDKLKAIEIINKMLGFNEPEKFDHTSKGESLPNRILIPIGDEMKEVIR